MAKVGPARKKKVGKGRLDKYYFLAKEHGYRARSAFKLIQLNQAYNLLSNIHSAVDLCAAPGGWLQVLSKTVRPPSKIVGVDLDPIKPIHGVHTIIGDITEKGCVSEILASVGETEVDLVLHDGAPNVGASWEKDAFVQNELVCHAAKLACRILKKNGAFVTKVFRSRDFSSLMWMLNQLFAECLATKPRSSRAESAEMFLVCRGYKKPEQLDEKFFDPQFLFADLEAQCEKGEWTLSNLLAERIDLAKCTKVRVDCMHEMVDEETKALLDDLQVVDDTDMRRLVRTLKKIQRAYVGSKGGNSPEEVVDLRTPAEREEAEIAEAKRVMQRREKVTRRKILAKRAKQLGLSEEDIQTVENVHGDFFEDNLFDETETEAESEDEGACESEQETESEDEEIDDGNSEEMDDEEADSCSSSLAMEDKVCGYRLKADEEEFENDGIDRYVFDDDETLPHFFRNDEEKYNRRHVYNEDREDMEKKVTVSKKVEEMRARRMRRVERKLKKIRDRLEAGEEEMDMRAVRKGAMKKEVRERPKMIFAGPSKSVPRLKGRFKMTDRRMKKDKAGLRRAEERKKGKKGKK
ncbi:AdoMet-dependent rRNA methyltransferase SPB1 [Nematocida major]|uniref:AdoMet-dependent rRNA methyltransferase SPB1 n=1 Tax=Nematocida major TaxID=1912982 RepID=UPI002007CFFD|nr:AdoMet-dependent rRNA methyltransferase SPB1 [Nematocida major]KAH9386684.1 AdoMet-dependent rRNA methyltransferase SPB1 [Nematocida major]